MPGKPDESLLIQAVAHTHDEIKMPPKGKLPEPASRRCRRWVEMGAPWPAELGQGPGGGSAPGPSRRHWAFQPVRLTAPPAVKDPGWVASPVDAFILARLESEGDRPVAAGRQADPDPPRDVRPAGAPADRRGGRRVRGRRGPRRLRPVVDRLLASPHYGERWGRHWLDVARYADTKGYVFTEERRYPYSPTPTATT